MRNKGAILFLTILITGICVFYLSFSWKKMNLVSKLNAKVEAEYNDSLTAYPKRYESKTNEAELKAGLRKRIRATHQAAMEKTESHLGFGYSDIDEYSLNLGLDLRGGMNATLVVSPVDFIKGIANSRSEEPLFVEALEEAKRRKQTDNRKYSEIFSEVWLETNKKEDLINYFIDQDKVNNFDAFTKYEEVIAYIDETFNKGLNKAVEVLRSRIDEFGTTQPIITPDYNSGRIEVELPGAEDEDRIRKKLNSVAQLEFCEVWENEPEVDQFLADLEKIVSVETAVEESSNKPTEGDSTQVENETEEDSLATAGTEEEFFDGEDEGDSTDVEDQKKVVKPLEKYFTVSAHQTQNGTIQRTYRAVNKFRFEELLERKAVKKLLKRNRGMMILWDRGGNSKGETDTSRNNIFYFIKKGPGIEIPLTGKHVKTANASFSSQNGAEIEVRMVMKPGGVSKWAKLTQENVGQRVAIILDNKVYSAPNVVGPITEGICSISGNFEQQDAEDLATIIASGQLPSPTEIEKMVFVGPTLGQEAIERGLISLLSGLGLVVLFMIAYYNKGGLVANIALLFNILFILGVLSIPKLGATLTLPGIAGIVLTIGMAIDANVLIFERIREELRLGKTMNNAVNIGYQKAFWTIVDSNVTTLITAILLASAGTGLVKGFGITLIIGICCSFFSSVYITRLFVESMIKNKDKPRISFTTALSKKLFQNSNFAIIKNRKKAYLFSLVVIIAGVSIMSTAGLNLGVEFKGGRSYVVKFNENVSSSEVKSKIQNQFDGTGMIVKTYNGDDRLRITTSYLKDTAAKTEVVDSIVRNRLETALYKHYQKIDPTIEEYQSTGPTMAYEIRITALKSMIYALIAIFLYILIRFNKWQFSVGAIFALFHDVMFVLSMFAIVGVLGITYELDEVFVAAILTIIGYSINDTVVVFDRVREFLRMNPKTALSTTLNNSINSTLSRTLMTSLTTLLVIVILFAFGGEALRGFSFALLVGVLVGTYSSIFIATPIVLDTTSAGKDGKVIFEEKKPLPSDDQTV